MITKSALPNKENVTYKMFHSSIWHSDSLFLLYEFRMYPKYPLRVESNQKKGLNPNKRIMQNMDQVNGSILWAEARGGGRDKYTIVPRDFVYVISP